MMRNSKFKTILLVLYFIFIITTCLILSGFIEFFSTCEYFANKKIVLPQMIIPIVVFPLIGYGVALVLKIEKSKRFLFYLIIPIISVAFILGYLSFKEKNYLYSSTCFVRIAKVKDINRGKNTHYVDVTYRKDGTRYKRNGVRFLGKSAVKTLHIGDSLLVLSVKDCDAIMYVYKPHPTVQEFRKCADYGYYFNGNLYSKEEFEGKNIE